jgi:LPXTG-motif cell wall-anchored protein
MKMKMISNVKEFSWAEMTSNSNGKTSGSGAAGIYLVFIGGVIGFIASMASLFGNDQAGASQGANVLLFAGATLTLGAGLLGYRKSVDKTAIENGKDPASLEGGGSSEPAAGEEK